MIVGSICYYKCMLSADFKFRIIKNINTMYVSILFIQHSRLNLKGSKYSPFFLFRSCLFVSVDTIGKRQPARKRILHSQMYNNTSLERCSSSCSPYIYYCLFSFFIVPFTKTLFPFSAALKGPLFLLLYVLKYHVYMRTNMRTWLFIAYL